MRPSKEDPSSSDAQAVDLISTVKELHGLTSQELNRLLRDSENFTIHYQTRKGSTSKIDMEKLAGSLPLHLISVLISSDRDESMMRYMLCGVRLLQSLCDLSRHSKLEQIFLDDVKVLEQLIDLVFYVMIVLGGYRQEGHTLSLKHLLHSALVACSLHLLTGFITTQWQDIVHVLLAHPKVDIFMDVAFGSVRMVVKFLEIALSVYHEEDFVEPNLTAERVVYFLTQQCEASLQFLLSLCQQKLFKERLLKNKELCGKGSILFLIRSILKLDIQPYFPTRIMAALSRLKSKMLSLLLSLCEAENTSYLDEVASSSQSLDLAKSVALEVFDVLKTAFGNDPQNLKSDKNYPMGFLQLNAMRLADIFSDDSNFRSYMTICFTKVLAAIFMLSHRDFLNCWCSSNLPEKEEDATLEYDIFAAVGWILENTSLEDLLNTANLEFNLVRNSMPQASYAHHRTSLFVKVIANLHCFVPNICEEQERNLFVLKVLECLQMDLSNSLPGFSFASDAPNATSICKNLRSLLSHAESLIPNFLNVEDVHLLRVFSDKLESLITSAGFRANRVQDSKDLSCDKFSKLNINEYQEAQSPGRSLSPLPVKELADLTKKGGNLKEGMSENSAFLDINHFDARAEDINQGAGLNPQDKMEDKIISGKTASEGARDADKDAQNVETSGSDTSSAKGKSVVDHIDSVELSKSAERGKKAGVGENPEDEKVETKQRKKRKRTIMNDEQVMLIERALLDEPEMQRNAASLLSWAEKLSHHGSEVTPAQLKNWLNNRKARLARTARDVRAAADADASVPDKQKGPVLGSCDSPDSPSDASNARKEHPSHSNITSGHKPDILMAEFVDLGPPEAGCKTSQYVVLVDKRGEEIGKGKVFQVSGKWCGKSLEELETCVVDIYELKADKGSRLPYPSEATGSSFADAETKLGVMRVLWDSNRIFVLRSE
ncbi:nodulin homeobox [Neltuma alba]|uniref:nodulin homeobox n=1 Tax=Neltuma alba TaxID=207710 RepID=UPI0010A3B844|nr:nodulin homeobox-like [Prosopis alba]XP_028756977.1 nodulin homeobox-like [Prosopis alba]XP_028756978.1 nodulin homeobox-like [Prosopis alba]XP_028756979.1 nodulin homeobox-like [Prosopis alba]